MDERRTLNPEVAGSNPALPTIGLLGLLAEESYSFRTRNLWYNLVLLRDHETRNHQAN